MDEQFKKISQGLVALDKKAEELDKLLRDVRMGILNVVWYFIELKKVKLKAEQKKTTE